MYLVPTYSLQTCLGDKLLVGNDLDMSLPSPAACDHANDVSIVMSARELAKDSIQFIPEICTACCAVHTMAELKLSGNHLKGSRPVLSFDEVCSLVDGFSCVPKLSRHVCWMFHFLENGRISTA